MAEEHEARLRAETERADAAEAEVDRLRRTLAVADEAYRIRGELCDALRTDNARLRAHHARCEWRDGPFVRVCDVCSGEEGPGIEVHVTYDTPAQWRDHEASEQHVRNLTRRGMTTPAGPVNVDANGHYVEE